MKVGVLASGSGTNLQALLDDPDEREAARRRWKHYAGRGDALQRFDVGASA